MSCTAQLPTGSPPAPSQREGVGPLADMGPSSAGETPATVDTPESSGRAQSASHCEGKGGQDR